MVKCVFIPNTISFYLYSFINIKRKTWIIRWSASGKAWIFNNDRLKMNKKLAQFIAYEDCVHPGLVKSNWQVFDGRKWREDPNITVTWDDIGEVILNSFY